MSKIIMEKHKNKLKNQEKTNNNLTTTAKETKILTIKKLSFLQKITYITIILHFILQVIIIYYENKIPWFTTGINNLINIITSIIPGGK
ncbi:hypothetical protein [Candidatus Phytoplasma phoenicium]|uniref:Uncharacterized protein n=1 Tax=Candidatus Phytoplasma phoenicium TaxID=198422 RepID=A0A0L0MJ24_9MOLU|nr:hypothetical protein [Candidatus Phytoplasma phoenicium]KND62647.1 hypothetical protein AlmWB_01550 [Candidatus Phytoplasma phoenicium]